MRFVYLILVRHEDLEEDDVGQEEADGQHDAIDRDDVVLEWEVDHVLDLE